MIIAIADDITGAAEIGGIGLRYGLKVCLADDIPASFTDDLLVVYTNTRSLSEDEAHEIMLQLTTKAQQLSPTLFYKKTDSVLRGHVLAELHAHMLATKKKVALLVPSNPALNRVIKGGTYFIADVPIHKTSFANDPEFPAHTASVKDRLGNTGNVKLVKAIEDMEEGVVVGEVQTMEDLNYWADVLSPEVLPAGAASFFDALLAKNLTEKEVIQLNGTASTSTTLLVSGTTFKKSIERRKKISQLVVPMPEAVFSGGDSDGSKFDEWIQQCIETIRLHNKAVIAIGEYESAGNALHLRQQLSKAVKKIVGACEIKELLVEGGSTAYTIVQQLNFHSFTPVNELEQGVVRMKVMNSQDLYLTIKPGSYDWPQQWKFN